MEINEKIRICKVVAQAILADCRITDSERDFINGLMDKYELNDEQRKDVMARNIGDDPAKLAEGIDSFDTKNELLVELAMAVAADGELSSCEKELIHSVATAIGVEDADIDMLVKTALID